MLIRSRLRGSMGIGGMGRLERERKVDFVAFWMEILVAPAGSLFKSEALVD